MTSLYETINRLLTGLDKIEPRPNYEPKIVQPTGQVSKPDRGRNMGNNPTQISTTKTET